MGKIRKIDCSCGKINVAHGGYNLCKSCYNKSRPKEKCNICDLNKTVQRRVNSKPICKSCYNKSRPKKKCSTCGNIKIIRKRTNNILLCSTCYQKNYIPPCKTCTICKKQSHIHKNTKYGSICKQCYDPPKKICFMCNRNKSVKRYYKDGPICNSCYNIYRYRNDESFRTISKLRASLLRGLKLYSKYGKIKSSKKYGIDYKKISEYLGKCPGDIENYHIDHIFPLVAFDLNNVVHIKAAFAPENHQWLLVNINLKKRAKYDKDKFAQYLRKF